MKKAALAILIAAAAACTTTRPPPGIYPREAPFTFGRMERDGRAIEAPVGSEINWPPDGGATIYLEGGAAQIRVFSQRAGGMNVNDRDVKRFFKKSLVRPHGKLMQEQRDEVKIYCQESMPVIRGSIRLRLAACLRVDGETRKSAIVTMAVFGAPEDRFADLGGARLCAEILRSARGFRP